MPKRAFRRLALAGLIAVPAVVAGQTTVELPFSVGLRLPTYDRVDGLTVAAGPIVSFGDGRVVLDPSIAYRSHLGTVDPRLAITVQRADSGLALVVTGERGTLTNERWIRGDLLNSVFSLGLGRDVHNYYRADRGEARAILRVPFALDTATVFAGGRFERDWSTGWRPGERNGPFSIFGRHDAVNGIERPNPEVVQEHIRSALVGGHVDLYEPRAAGRLDALVEAGSPDVGGAFTQLTADGALRIPTVAGERLAFGGHLVTTAGNTAPPQRWSYVGGSGTLAASDLLVRGGDHLYFVDTWYEIPLPRVDLPLLGQPWIGPRFAAGAAGVGGFGAPIQNVGVRLGAAIFQVDVVIEPRTRQRSYGVGIALDER